MPNVLARIFALCLFVSGTAGQVWAQTAYDAALARVQAAPDDPRISLEFVQAAIDARQVRPAIGRLEALLARRPDLANIRLELGLLYLEAGSPQLAERFIRDALRAPDVPTPVRSRAEAALERALVGQRRAWVEFELAVTTRVESNALAAPGSTGVQRVVAGTEVVANLDTEDTAQSDFSISGAAGARFGFDLGNQAADRITGSVNYFGTRYLEEDELNLDVISGDVGPEISVGGAGRIATIRPFVQGSFIRQEGVNFLSSFGGGADAQLALSPRSRASARGEVRNSDFIRTEENPANDLRDAVQYVFRGGIGYEISPSLAFFGAAGMTRNAAESAFESYWEGTYRLAVSYTFTDPVGVFADPLSASFSTSYRHRRHDRPDIAIDLNDAQRDNRASTDLTLRFPITDRASLEVRGGYVLNASNYAIEDFSNFSLSSRLAVRF